MTRILMTITAGYRTIRLIVEMTIQNLMTSLLGDHPWKQSESSLRRIPLCQHFENESRHLHLLLHWRNHYILSIGKSRLSQRTRMYTSLSHWYPRRYSITGLNDWIRPLMYIFTRGRIQTNPVSIWLHGKLKICGNMSTWLTTWQASL